MMIGRVLAAAGGWLVALKKWLVHEMKRRRTRCFLDMPILFFVRYRFKLKYKKILLLLYIIICGILKVCCYLVSKKNIYLFI